MDWLSIDPGFPPANDALIMVFNPSTMVWPVFAAYCTELGYLALADGGVEAQLSDFTHFCYVTLPSTP